MNRQVVGADAQRLGLRLHYAQRRRDATFQPPCGAAKAVDDDCHARLVAQSLVLGGAVDHVGIANGGGRMFITMDHYQAD